MKKKNKNTNAPITSLSDDLRSIWDLSKDAKPATVVTEQETEQSLQDIWGKVDRVEKPKMLFKPYYAVAAITFIAALVGFLNYFTIEKVSSPGQTTEISLRDGSIIFLTGNSTIQYSLLFGITNRDIELNGQALFEVASDENQPFTITSPNFTTTVLGTVFEIEDWDGAILTTPNVRVHEGIVEVKNESSSITLYQNEGVNVVENSIIEEDYSATKKQQLINWDDSRVSFYNIPLNQLFERLSLQFGVDIQFEEGIQSTESVSGSYRFDTSLEEIILDVATIKNLSYQKTNNGFIIR